MSDRLFGAACIALAVFYVYAASQTEVSFMSDPLGPKVFPYIIGTVLAVAGVFPIIRPDAEPEWPRLGRLLEIIFAAAVMVAYTYALPEFGFVVSTAVAAALLSWRLGALPPAAIAAGIAISVGIYVIFHLILKLSLAAGPWGF
ncbi:MAG: tripartite tricarboxylate transporter TctB family protein [Alphaproteobacteria bacterium]|nr:tripartite tricarboxylate transporter TctB family protein [Alphaproteobacteria bacterium]